MNPMLWSIPSDARVKMFFALRPPEGTDREITSLGYRLRSAHGMEGPVTSEDRVHLTLAALDFRRWPAEETVMRARRAAARMRHRVFAVRFDRTQSFVLRDGRRPLVLRGDDRLDELPDFRGDLAAAMRAVGLPDPGSFTPHVTMVWGDRAVEEYPIRPIGWTVGSFVLVMSLVGYSCHIVIGRWPLAGSAEE